MTTREELVERVARAIEYRWYNEPRTPTQDVSVLFRSMARAAIAECEKAWDVTYTIQAPKELAEAQAKIATLEAQCAAMLAAAPKKPEGNI